MHGSIGRTDSLAPEQLEGSAPMMQPVNQCLGGRGDIEDWHLVMGGKGHPSGHGSLPPGSCLMPHASCLFPPPAPRRATEHTATTPHCHNKDGNDDCQLAQPPMQPIPDPLRDAAACDSCGLDMMRCICIQGIRCCTSRLCFGPSCCRYSVRAPLIVGKSPTFTVQVQWQSYLPRRICRIECTCSNNAPSAWHYNTVHAPWADLEWVALSRREFHTVRSHIPHGLKHHCTLDMASLVLRFKTAPHSPFLSLLLSPGALRHIYS
jgi:hypothetical protein